MKRIYTLSLLVFLCVCSMPLYAQQQASTGQDKPTSQKKNIKVFPNPATTLVTILGLSNSDKANITVSDLYGNALIQHQWRIKNNALNIPITTLSPGLYIVNIHSREQNVQTKFYKK